MTSQMNPNDLGRCETAKRSNLKEQTLVREIKSGNREKENTQGILNQIGSTNYNLEYV